MNIKLKESLKIVSYYIVVSFLLISFSDKILHVFFKDTVFYKLFHNYKGAFFILLTSGLLLKLIQNSYLKIDNLHLCYRK